MLNKTENNTNISSITPCSTEGLIAVTGNDGETHIIQRELISHSVKGQETTIIHLVTGKWIMVSLSPEILAKKLGITVSE
ncbi:cobalamin biosynthesis protein CbiX [Escherichia coli]|uniref:cobalamin biosynthesis protein CbiX n=1 Tax=Gammaproteobacteria TaxID=1236 RepID=UPI000F9F95CF|nr:MULTISPECIES: cobalamin biosynthesis protein CbiX [Gammaproteobacteria]ECA8457351.1 cobalamin biosynthesis protein CbiX [Salmonella enterica subsp. enterica serovar Kentucky]ELK3497897.1 cobalamin biosynthesis protein CbiX [Salmonella enterica]MDY1763630.1 cobalamin biosynthesis protein CbiX [Klebsiella pneumoniae]MKK13024.1 cobalamin biosynthesis protein CbiX [Salmonella enterica subsp. enterica serovar Newport]EFL2682491.1 cobalamin biosynthesis protein CbiX [Escherichia coli]